MLQLPVFPLMVRCAVDHLVAAGAAGGSDLVAKATLAAVQRGFLHLEVGVNLLPVGTGSLQWIKIKCGHGIKEKGRNRDLLG